MKFVKALEPLVSRVRVDVTARKHNGKMRWTKEPLTEALLIQHVSGGPARGVCPIKAGETTTMVALLDLDSHYGEIPRIKMWAIAENISTILAEHDMKPIPFTSSGGMGVHILMLWEKPQDAYSVRQFLFNVLHGAGYKNGTGGVAKGQIEVFPKQDHVPIDGYGSQFILPLAGKSEPLDPELHFIPAGREYVLTMDWPSSSPVPVIEKKIIERSPQLPVRSSALSSLKKMLCYIDPDCGYAIWINVGMSLHAETGGSKDGLELWDEWSSGALKSKEPQIATSYEGRDDLEPHWKSFKSNKATMVKLGTIKHLAYQGGWRENTFNDRDFEDVTKQEKTLRDRFCVIPAVQFVKGKPAEWIVKGVLPKAALAMIFGPSGSGKTFLVLDIIMSIARGIDWYGRKVQKGRVIYIAAEGIGGIRKRLNAYANHYGISLEELQIGIVSDTPDLRTKDHELMAQKINDAGGASVIVVDTLAQASPGANENDSEDMGTIINRCKLLHEMTGAVVLLVHHTGKDAGKGARGWSGIKGALDMEIEVSHDKNKGQRKAQITKQKDDESGAEFHFTLEKVALGTDDDGETVTSCVIESQNVSAFTDCSRPQGRWQKVIHDTANELIGVSETSISLEEVISEAMKLIPYDASQKSKRDRRRENLQRAAHDLHANSIIIIENNLVSLPHFHETPQSG